VELHAERVDAGQDEVAGLIVEEVDGAALQAAAEQHAVGVLDQLGEALG
jgi:hypothetical protein